MQRLKPKHCSYSANWTNQIGTVAIVQNLKNSKRKKEIKKKKIKGLNKPNVYCTGIGAFYRVRLSFRSIISHFKINEWCVAHKWSKGRKKDTSNPFISQVIFSSLPLSSLCNIASMPTHCQWIGQSNTAQKFKEFLTISSLFQTTWALQRNQ